MTIAQDICMNIVIGILFMKKLFFYRLIFLFILNKLDIFENLNIEKCEIKINTWFSLKTIIEFYMFVMILILKEIYHYIILKKCILIVKEKLYLKNASQLELSFFYVFLTKREIFVRKRSLEVPDNSSSQRQPLSAVGTLYSALSASLLQWSTSLASYENVGAINRTKLTENLIKNTVLIKWIRNRLKKKLKQRPKTPTKTQTKATKNDEGSSRRNI